MTAFIKKMKRLKLGVKELNVLGWTPPEVERNENILFAALPGWEHEEQTAESSNIVIILLLT